MIENLGPLLLIATILILIIVNIVWVISIYIKNASIIDIFWAYGFSVITILYSMYLEGYYFRKIIITGMVLFWSIRLGTHLCLRVIKSHPIEDIRYQKLRIKWGELSNRNLFYFFQIQGLSLILFTIPFLLILTNKLTKIQIFEYIGVTIWAIGVIGESIADYQLVCFKKLANKKKVCNVGLWNYSRHPNYFFEWIIWVGFFLFSLGSPYGLTTIYCPLLMLYCLLKLTGIKFLEEQALASKGQEYRQYQKTTSMFIPWVKKHELD